MEDTPDEIIPRMRHRVSRIIQTVMIGGESPMPILEERREGRSGGVSNGTENVKPLQFSDFPACMSYQPILRTSSRLHKESGSHCPNTKEVQPFPSIHSGLGKPV